MALNLEKQLVFYGSYHNNPVNIGIHMVFVPLIMFTSFLWGTNTPSIPLPLGLQIPYYPLNLGTIVALLYSTLYILMEPVAGLLATPIITGFAALGTHLTASYGATANYYAGAAWVASWIMQFLGHGKFEGRAPALMDNLVQALFLAPFFVWLELLFAVGYRPELRKRVDSGIEKEVRKFRKEKEKAQAVKANGTANGTAKASKKEL